MMKPRCRMLGLRGVVARVGWSPLLLRWSLWQFSFRNTGTELFDGLESRFGSPSRIESDVAAPWNQPHQMPVRQFPEGQQFVAEERDQHLVGDRFFQFFLLETQQELCQIACLHGSILL